MLHIIIESYKSFEYANKKFPSKSISWHTSSPALFDQLKFKNETVLPIESNITFGEKSNILNLSIESANSISTYLNTLNDFDSKINIGRVIERNLQQITFILLLKFKILSNWHKNYNTKGNSLKIVGDTRIRELNGFNLSVGRFDDLYSAIAKLSQDSFQEIELIKINNGRIENIKTSDCENTLLRYERYLNFIQYSPSKIFLHIYNKIGLDKVRSKIKKNKLQAVTIKTYDSIDDLAFTFLTKSYDLKKRSDLNFLDTLFDESIEIDLNKKEFLKYCFNIYSDLADVYLININEIDSLILLISQRLYSCLEYGKKLLSEMPTIFKSITKNYDHTCILTNHLTNPAGKLLQSYLISRGVSFFSFEHGVTAGIDHVFSLTESRNYSSYGGDYWLCVSENSLKARTSDINSKGGISIGLSSTNRPKILRPIIKRFIKYKLNYKKDETVFMYLAPCERNNLLSVTGINDYDCYEKTLTMINNVFKHLSVECIVKLYPGTRYLDDFNLSYCQIPKNTKIIKHVDFNILRHLPDVIISSVYSSTLGWCMSAKVPVIFIDSPESPLTKDAYKCLKDSVFLIDGSKINWHDDLLILLKTPIKVLEEMWSSKQEMRSIFEKKYLSGVLDNKNDIFSYIHQRTTDNHQNI